MLDRADYTLSDFLLFSARVYYRTLELHNAALWPLHVLALVAGACIVLCLLRPTLLGMRFSYALLAVAWLFVAWTFFLDRYATINWAAAYLAPAIGAQGLLLGIMAIKLKATNLTYSGNARRTLAIGLVVFSLIGYPLLAFAFGRPWHAAELFGIAPDPTATATLAVLALGRGILAVLAAIVPVVWIIITSLTLHTLGAVDFFVPALLALASAVAAYAQSRARNIISDPASR